jgi:outer membrane autotransporter protein
MILNGLSENNTNRSIPVYGDTAKGSYHSWFANIGAQLGKNIYAMNQDLVLTPELDANYLFVHQGSYAESGSLMDLSVDSTNYTSLVLGAYGRAAYHVATFRNHENLMVSAYGGLARDVFDHKLQTTAAFVAGGSSFTTAGPDLHGFFFRGGVGVTVAGQTKPLEIALNYDFQAGNNTFSNVGALTLKYVF